VGVEALVGGVWSFGTSRSVGMRSYERWKGELDAAIKDDPLSISVFGLLRIGLVPLF